MHLLRNKKNDHNSPRQANNCAEGVLFNVPAASPQIFLAAATGS